MFHRVLLGFGARGGGSHFCRYKKKKKQVYDKQGSDRHALKTDKICMHLCTKNWPYMH